MARCTILGIYPKTHTNRFKKPSNFSPHGYNLPLEYTKLAAECSRSRPQSGRNETNYSLDEKPIWICKPVAQSQGKGIFLFKVTEKIFTKLYLTSNNKTINRNLVN